MTRLIYSTTRAESSSQDDELSMSHVIRCSNIVRLSRSKVELKSLGVILSLGPLRKVDHNGRDAKGKTRTNVL